MGIEEYERTEIRELIAKHEPVDLGTLISNSRHPRDRIRNIIQTDSQLIFVSSDPDLIRISDADCSRNSGINKLS